MIEPVTLMRIRCDSCGAIYGFEEDEALYEDEAAAAHTIEGFDEAEWWSTDGEGLVACPACPALQLTEAAKAERARRPGPGDVPLPDLAAI